jgi:hypothetical protein
MVQALGQSNAGNHGAISRKVRQDEEAMFYFEGHCYKTNGVSPGATGRDANLWAVLAPRLTKAFNRPVVFSVLAVEATRIADWAEPGELQSRLLATLADNREHAFVPDVVIWQQGEADASAGTGMDEYRATFSTLIALLRREGVNAPILAGMSTRCRNNGSENVRTALKAVSLKDPTVRLGADTDVLTGQYRLDGCHFSSAGLNAAADLWLPIIAAGYH